MDSFSSPAYFQTSNDRRSNRGRGRGRGRGGNRGRGFSRNFRQSSRGGAYSSFQKKSVINGGVQQRKRDGFKVQANTKRGKLMINNLHFKVTDNDIEQLFGKFGKLTRASVHYNSQGKSLGSAEVIYIDVRDAARAMKQYNDVPLDERPMKICLVGADNQPLPANAGSIESRLGKRVFTPTRAFNSQNGRGRGSRGRGRLGNRSRGRGRGQSRGTGRGRGGRGRGGKIYKDTPVSAADLDKQLDAYINQN